MSKEKLKGAKKMKTGEFVILFPEDYDEAHPEYDLAVFGCIDLKKRPKRPNASAGGGGK